MGNLDKISDQEKAEQCIAKMLGKDGCSTKHGIELIKVGPGWAEMGMTVTESMLNGHALCHGGMIFTLADSTFACACNTYDRITVAQGVKIDFVRPAQLHDRLTATGRERKRGRTTGIYDIEIVNQNNNLVALFRGQAFITEKKILTHEEKL